VRQRALLLTFAIAALSACAAPATSLRVERFAEDPAESHFVPLNRTIADAATVARLEELVRSLPPAPTMGFGCGIGGGLRYRLTFRGTPKTSLTAIVAGDGCRVTHLGPFDRRATTETFWAELAGALGFYTRGNDLFPLPREMGGP
jgi:hypothetical protein